MTNSPHSPKTTWTVCVELPSGKVLAAETKAVDKDEAYANFVNGKDEVKQLKVIAIEQMSIQQFQKKRTDLIFFSNKRLAL